MSSHIDTKMLETMRARAALAGYRLLRTDQRDGQVVYMIEKLGVIRALRSIDDAEALVIHANGVRP